MSKKGLGKGLGALIRENDEIKENSIVELKLTEIESNENQPRRHFDDEALNNLADSIREHGVVQPIIVRKLEHGYQIVAGERRWRASRLAGLKSIPAIIKDFSNVQVMEVALIENLQREDLNPIEEAAAYKSLLDEYNLTQDEIAKRIGKSRPAIANSMRLLNLSDDIKKLVAEGKISAGHARALLSISNEKKRFEVAQKIIDQQLNVREIENIAKGAEKRDRPALKKDLDIIELEDKLKGLLGTKVNINHKKNRGKIEIEYYSNDDLNRILDLLEK
ncbi:MAG: ParB/RepB/Spo0J family partition protein [Bacillota bacterium]